MASNDNLHRAKVANNNEFYTRYDDIQREIDAYVDEDPDVFRGKTVLLPCDDPEWSKFTLFFVNNFKSYGLKKLISTSYGGLRGEKGKVFTLEGDTDGNGRIDMDDLTWKWLEGDGDFRSEEVTRLRNEADVIITNPPFNTLFREFIAWIMEAGKKFVVIGNKNAVGYKEIFPLIKENKLWLGYSGVDGMWFNHNNGTDRTDRTTRVEDGNEQSWVSACWYANLPHCRRHHPLLMSRMKDRISLGRDTKKEAVLYKKYDNYDAIEVPTVKDIPSDYEGVMGVPITFLDKYCPEQFEIIGFRYGDDGKDLSINGKCPYSRILIKAKKGATSETERP